MSGSKLTGKTKGDLIEIAHLSGLLTARETSRMTKAQLLNFLLNVEGESEVGLISGEAKDMGKHAEAEKEPAKTSRSRQKTEQTEPAESRTETTSEKPKRRGRPPKQVKTAEIKTAQETETVSASAVRKVKPAEKLLPPVQIPIAEESAPAAEPAPSEELKPAAEETPAAAEVKAEPAAQDQAEKSELNQTKQTRKSAKADESKAKQARGRKRQIELTETLPAEQLADDKAEVAPAKEAAEAEAAGKSAAEKQAAEKQTAKSPADKTKTKSKNGHREKGGSNGRNDAPGEDAGEVKETEPPEIVSGVLEIMPDGYGFLRKDNYLQGNHDIYVPPQYIRRFSLRNGDLLSGPARQQRETDRYQALYYIKEVNGMTPDKMFRRPHFDRLTPIYPNERFVLETGRTELSTRIIDLIAPIGKGQRGMIVSPPKAGKTILMQKIANAISQNNPEAKLIVLLIDERPEEVTDMQRSIDGEVVYSTFDKTPENHVKVTELVLERAMRLVELGQDVVILLDSITRMARAYNLTINPTGRTLSGGLDPGALYGPKRFFGAARNIEHGGSLTIIATALIDTGSRMDEVIFEEFKGTGNMEVYLDRKLSEKRIFPAIDINRSSTRREDLLLSPTELDSVWAIRKAFGQLDTAAVTETIISLLLKTKNNSQFITSINVSFNDKAVFDAMRGSAKSGGANGSPNNAAY